MGMDVYVRGVIEPNEGYKKMYAVYEACKDAGVNVPDEVLEYFGDDTPTPSGMRVKIPTKRLPGEYDNAIEIDLKSLRSDISKIHVVISV